MARPRKDPGDPKWQEDFPQDWKMYFAAALTGLISRGGASSDQMIKTARQYADEAYQTLMTSPRK